MSKPGNFPCFQSSLFTKELFIDDGPTAVLTLIYSFIYFLYLRILRNPNPPPLTPNYFRSIHRHLLISSISSISILSPVTVNRENAGALTTRTQVKVFTIKSALFVNARLDKEAHRHMRRQHNHPHRWPKELYGRPWYSLFLAILALASRRYALYTAVSAN